MNIVEQMKRSGQQTRMAPVTVSRSSILGPNIVRQMEESAHQTRMRPVTVSRSSILGPNVVDEMRRSGQQTRMAPVTVSRSSILGSRTPTSSIRAAMVPVTTVSRSNIPQTRSLTPSGIIPGLPAGLGIMPSRAVSSGSTRTGVIPPSTLTYQGGPAAAPTASAFGGAGGGAGSSGVSGGDLGLGGIGTSISSLGSGIMGTITGLIPLAIKVVLAVIIIKIVLWLLRGRRR